MKCILPLIAFFIFSSLFNAVNIFGQNVGINTDGSLPNPNAMLDVKSTNKGILIPRIDYNNRPTVNVPSGMLIYVVTNGPLGNNAYYYYNGTD